MKRKTKKAIAWTVPGLVLSLLLILLVLSGLKGHVMIADTEGIGQSADRLMECVQSGDWETLNRLIADNTGIHPKTGSEDTAENMIWNAYQQSLQWRCADQYKLDGSRVTLDIEVTCLDISAFTRNLTGILAESSDGEQREASLAAAVKESLEGELPTTQQTITLHFVRGDGRWQIVSNQALLALLSGFTAK